MGLSLSPLVNDFHCVLNGVLADLRDCCDNFIVTVDYGVLFILPAFNKSPLHCVFFSGMT